MSRFKWLLGAIILSVTFALTIFVETPTFENTEQIEESLVPAPMPLYQSPDFPEITNLIAPEAHRDASVRRYLAPSMRIRNGGVSGSGTICYYDRERNIAYVISCSHLFRSASEKTVTLEFFYKNDQKLDTPAKYTGEVICAKINGYEDDISFIKFTPDWQPTYFPIAKQDYVYEPGSKLYSVGCDGAGEVGCYFVKVVGADSTFLATRENSPRPGRSGGGLITEDGRYVGICVRTSDVSGNGTGYFVQLKTIHTYARANNLGWLLEVRQPNEFLRNIPIIDRNTPQRQYPPDYIPLP